MPLVLPPPPYSPPPPQPSASTAPSAPTTDDADHPPFATVLRQAGHHAAKTASDAQTQPATKTNATNKAGSKGQPTAGSGGSKTGSAAAKANAAATDEPATPTVKPKQSSQQAAPAPQQSQAKKQATQAEEQPPDTTSEEEEQAASERGEPQSRQPAKKHETIASDVEKGAPALVVSPRPAAEQHSASQHVSTQTDASQQTQTVTVLQHVLPEQQTQSPQGAGQNSLDGSAPTGPQQTQVALKPATKVAAAVAKLNESANAAHGQSDADPTSTPTDTAAPADTELAAATAALASAGAATLVAPPAAAVPQHVEPAAVLAALPVSPPAAPEASFATANHPQIITGIHGQLFPSGGTMTLRLAPPELGDLQINVHVRDGVIAATFQTSNDEATRQLSHSLGQLKNALESAGVSVEKLQVTQTPRGQSSSQSGDSSSDQSQQQPTERQTQREQQRRELLERMWRKVTGGDPLDMVA
jgi:flagellar hook-length control protein FliK